MPTVKSSLQGKICLVTGANSGIGQRLDKNGCSHTCSGTTLPITLGWNALARTYNA